MKLLITAIIALGLGLGAWQIYQYWEKIPANQHTAEPAPAVPTPPPIPSGDELAGLPPRLQSAYDAAQQRGAAGLRDFLAAHGKEVADPRLASIQLDYVLQVTTSDLAEARRVFAKVKERIQPNSPIYSRVQQMATTYQ